VTDAVRALVDVSALLALGDRAGLDAALAHAATVTPDDAVEEALLQSYLFLGYPAALYGLSVWRKLRPPPPPSPAADGDLTEWQARGDATCARVYGEQYARLRGNVAALHPDLERWMIVEGYGKVLSRPGLDLATRELCIVALLAPQDAAPQLYSHLRGALNAGAPEDSVDDVVRYLEGKLPPARATTLKQQWDAVRGRRR